MSVAETTAARPRPRAVLNGSALAATLIVAAILRAWRLGASSFWYDEVVTMRLAESPTIAGLFRLLFQIDATRAPLHPLILQDWIAMFGNSEAAARSLSVVLGVAAVALLYVLGRLAFDESTGLWAAFLGVFSPLLVYYSRETRMYALLVLVTTLCWTLLFWLRRAASRWKEVGYAVCLAAMLLTHPLGLLMLGTLGLASMLDVRGFFGSWKGWLAVHLSALIVTAPWLRFYFDHAPEFLSGRLSIKFLLATPIGFLGGDSTTYLLILALIAFGLYRRRIIKATNIWRAQGPINQPAQASFSPRGKVVEDRMRDAGDTTDSASSKTNSDGTAEPRRDWVAPACLALWLSLPPAILYVYSWIANPIFGPARYTLFCAPAYLVLIAQALARIPPLSRWTLGLGLACLAVFALKPIVFDPPTRADWRWYPDHLAWRPSRHSQAEPTWNTIVMLASEAEPPVEFETARYYLERVYPVVPFDEGELKAMMERPRQRVYVIVGGRPRPGASPTLQERLEPFVKGVRGYSSGSLQVYQLESFEYAPPVRRPPPAPGPAAPGRPAPG